MNKHQRTIWLKQGEILLLAGFLMLGAWLFPALAADPPVILRPADEAITPVILHPASQEFPDVDGRRVVWQDFRYGPTDIFMADLDSNEITNLTNTNYDKWEVQPDLDGDVIVWKDGYNGIGIHGMRLSTGQVFTVTEGHSDTSRPHLSGNIVVWADNRAGGEDWNIYGYNLDTGTEFVINADPGRQQDPQIDGNWVVWWDYQEYVYLYNLQTHQTQTVHPTWGARLPDVSAVDRLVVWQDYRNGNWDIYGYDLDTDAEIPLLIAAEAQENVAVAAGLLTFQTQVAGISWNIGLSVLSTTHQMTDSLTFAVTDNSNPQLYPVVDGTTIVWQDSRNHQTDIYRFEWTGSVPPATVYPVTAPTGFQVGAFPGYQIRLQWQDAIPNEIGFVVERAQGIAGSDWIEQATLPANTTVYTDLSGLPGETYWYRVRAYNDEGFSAYSNEAFNSTFDFVPSFDEQYLMVLFNEARADPSAFGYPAYAPVPPLRYNPLLAYSARSHSQSILNSGYQFGHCDPIGRCPTERAQAVGYIGGCGENLTMGNTGPVAMESANQGFMDSEGHRNNMLSASLNEFGIGHTYDPAKGNYWFHGQFTEVFAGRETVTPPVIPGGIVVPYTGTVGTVFTYVVNFYSAEGYTPEVAEVVIDGVAHPLTLSTGTASLGTYRYATRLNLGSDHNYYFRFEYGNGQIARYPENEAVNLPDVRGPMPDLQATLSSWVDEQQVVYLWGDISNQGEITATNVPVKLYLGHPNSGGTVITQTVFTEIQTGTTQAINTSWHPDVGGVYTFYLSVDPDRTVPDMDYTNNMVANTVNITLYPYTIYLPFISKFGPE